MPPSLPGLQILKTMTSAHQAEQEFIFKKEPAMNFYTPNSPIQSNINFGLLETHLGQAAILCY